MTKNAFLYIMLLGGLLLTTPAHAENPISKISVIQDIRNIVQSVPTIHPKITLALGDFMNKDVSDLQEEDFIEITQTIIKYAAHQVTPEQLTQLHKIKGLMDRKLKSYKASGVAFTVDPNGAFCVDTIDPKFTITFKDNNGKTKTKTYLADINLIGLNIEFTFRLSWIFFLGDVNYFDANKTIELGTGIEIEPLSFLMPLIGDNTTKVVLNTLTNTIITYCPFKNIPTGGLLIISKPILGLAAGSLSLVRGGTLTPV